MSFDIYLYIYVAITTVMICGAFPSSRSFLIPFFSDHLPLPLIPDNHWPAFCNYHCFFIKIGISRCVFSLLCLPSFTYCMQCLWDSFMLLLILVVCSFSLLLICWVDGHLSCFQFWTIWVKFLWAFEYRSLYWHRLLFAWLYKKWHFWIVCMLICIRNCQVDFQGGCTVLHSHQ